jgi:hypothetical protein
VKELGGGWVEDKIRGEERREEKRRQDRKGR